MQTGSLRIMKAEKHKEKPTGKHRIAIFKILDYVSEIAGWAVIVISLSGFAGIIAFLLHLFIAGTPGIIIGCLVFAAGIICSIIYACYIWRTKGTINFISNSSWTHNNTESEN